MDKITDSYIDSILRNSKTDITISHMSCVMTVTLPNGYTVSSVYPFLCDNPDHNEVTIAQRSCENNIRQRVREFEAYHLMSMENMN